MNASGWTTPEVGWSQRSRGFHADQGEIFKVVDRLIDETELVLVEGGSQVELELGTGAGRMWVCISG